MGAPLRAITTTAAGRAAPMAAALLAQWLVRALDPAIPFAPYEAGAFVIRHTPGPLATELIERLGHAAKESLGLGAIALLLVASLVVPRGRASIALVAASMALCLLAGGRDPDSRMALAFATALAGAALATVPLRAPPAGAAGRRQLLLGGAATLALFAAGGVAAGRGRRGAVPVLAAPVDIAPDGTFVDVPGLSPRITAPDDLYRVDIALDHPRLDAGGWRLAVGGEVANPRTFTFAEIAAMPATTQAIHMHCISNTVGGPLMSNAVWTAFPLARLLEAAGAAPGATHVRVEAADGYDETVLLADAGDVLVAYAVGGAAIPAEHGYPVRLIFPGRYGMRSVKWVTSLAVAAGRKEGWWERRGWTDDAFMKTGSRIDTPRAGARAARQVTIAGVAWAGTRGVDAVEVSVDGGRSWREAALEAPAGPLAWRRWQLPMEFAAGRHRVLARARDATGAYQVAEPSFPHPSGATGLHEVTFLVS